MAARTSDDHVSSPRAGPQTKPGCWLEESEDGLLGGSAQSPPCLPSQSSLSDPRAEEDGGGVGGEKEVGGVRVAMGRGRKRYS